LSCQSSGSACLCYNLKEPPVRCFIELITLFVSNLAKDKPSLPGEEFFSLIECVLSMNGGQESWYPHSHELFFLMFPKHLHNSSTKIVTHSRSFKCLHFSWESTSVAVLFRTLLHTVMKCQRTYLSFSYILSPVLSSKIYTDTSLDSGFSRVLMSQCFR
jgi:hypothetical protein